MAAIKNLTELAEKLIEDRTMIEQALLDNLPVPVFTTATDGDWLTTNEPMQRMLVLKPAQLTGIGWTAAILPEHQAAALIDYGAVFKAKSVQAKIAIRFDTRDKRHFIGHLHLLRLPSTVYLGLLFPACLSANINKCPLHAFLFGDVPKSKKVKRSV